MAFRWVFSQEYTGGDSSTSTIATRNILSEVSEIRWVTLDVPEDWVQVRLLWGANE